MPRVLIAVDFSKTSFNAARYAAGMLSGQKDALAILYHNYQNSHERDNCISYLESLKQEFLDKGVAAVEYESEMGGNFVDNLVRLAHNRTATSVVMGITGHSALKEVMMGNSTIEMVKRNFCPVLIIPPEAQYNGIKNVAFASQFIDVETTTPDALIKSVLDIFHPFLHIVNVSSKHYIALTEEVREQQDKMSEMFKNYKHEFYFIGLNDFFDAIDNFTRDYNIDMLITVPGYHGAMDYLFKRTYTQKLAYHISIPLLAVHQ
ncbi:MAG: universal stress protein [Chitinophagaceae bacterium]|jgi:nucleotide-binding universal stress UspA family protein|nr:universal stress protein [Chitinophagaceae bacterium]OQY92155.1 MAG: hypothetical protein B6D37_15225 [Sphingobacteriales bacterium UTBCD1]